MVYYTIIADRPHKIGARMVISNSPEDTKKIGVGYGKNAKPGDVICLTGGLSAGKTVFAKGFAEGLGVSPDIEIVSPTFVIVNEYEGRLPFFHFDVYRCVPEDMSDIGLDDYFSRGGVVLIEWAERIIGLIPPDSLWIAITGGEIADNVRRIG